MVSELGFSFRGRVSVDDNFGVGVGRKQHMLLSIGGNVALMNFEIHHCDTAKGWWSEEKWVGPSESSTTGM